MKITALDKETEELLQFCENNGFLYLSMLVLELAENMKIKILSVAELNPEVCATRKIRNPHVFYFSAFIHGEFQYILTLGNILDSQPVSPLESLKGMFLDEDNTPVNFWQSLDAAAKTFLYMIKEAPGITIMYEGNHIFTVICENHL
ncbi:MAG: hypothetical protein RI996_48 [Candidatus Parcubacteria bacterium]|jgi:hypothetical protein